MHICALLSELLIRSIYGAEYELLRVLNINVFDFSVHFRLYIGHHRESSRLLLLHSDVV